MEFISAGIAWICLHVWYRDRKKVEKILNKKYDGQYSVAGGIMFLNLIAAVGALTMFGLLIFVLVDWIHDAITK